MVATDPPKGLLGWLRFLGLPSFGAAPYQMIFIGGFAVAIGLSMTVAALLFGFPVPIWGPFGLFVLGALGIFGGIWRIKDEPRIK